jgi:hypothetical protein
MAVRLPVVAVVLHLLVARAAIADDEQLALTPLPSRDAPDLTLGSEATCVYPPGLITTRKLAVGGSVIAIVHDCGQTDEATRLAIRGETGWFESAAITYAYQGSHMSIAPGFSRLLDESLSTGTLADGRVALVHRVTRQKGNRCWKASACPPGTESASVDSAVEVCALDVPACGHAAFDCPASGCTPAVLRDGILAIQTDRGRRRLRVQ